MTKRQLILKNNSFWRAEKKWRNNKNSGAEQTEEPHATTVWAIRHIDRTQPVTTEKMMMMALKKAAPKDGGEKEIEWASQRDAGDWNPFT